MELGVTRGFGYNRSLEKKKLREGLFGYPEGRRFGYKVILQSQRFRGAFLYIFILLSSEPRPNPVEFSVDILGPLRNKQFCTGRRNFIAYITS